MRIPQIGAVRRWRGRRYVITAACGICGSPIGVPVVPRDGGPPPEEVYTCRCRELHPDAFTKPRSADELGYATGRRARIRSTVH